MDLGVLDTLEALVAELEMHHLHHQNTAVRPVRATAVCSANTTTTEVAHDSKIDLKMTPDGTLTITYSDGTTETTVAPIHQPPLPHAA